MKKKNNVEKKKLVNLFKVMDHYKLNDLTANHASVLSKDGKGFFINQHKLLFSEISQNNLKYVSLNDNYSKKTSTNK
ncbi:class II aldolase/adducin family protein [Candidatus Pelagibacter sp.]|nr:class II aldolase/adducin family protein [Candidatus Pelagibacter sp.]